MKNHKLILILFLLFYSCELIDFKDRDSGINLKDSQKLRPVARAHDKYLYLTDLEGLVPPEISKSDSAGLVQRYIKSWIDKQLVISEASNKLNLDEAEIERKVLDYRYALLIHEYQKLYINDNLDLNVTDKEIETYYRDNKDNFELRHHIIKCRFVKLPLEAPKLSVFRRLFRSVDEKQFEELRSYCYQYATTFHLDSTWMNFDEVLENTPMVTINNKIQFLRNNRNYETKDDVYYYFLSINDYKISEQISPLEWVRDDIQKIIINKRKVKLAKDLEDGIYNRAVKNEDFEIYTE
ncbi:MAG: peptidyl-prolyl cis-trans isomerase [Cyclobacteriaceae bacterium]|nr:peptidyl-prolyl cis-trans isomerase [Cyclobacteriaceae bacterium]